MPYVHSLHTVFLPQGIKRLVYVAHNSLCMIKLATKNSDCRAILLYFDGFTHILKPIEDFLSIDRVQFYKIAVSNYY